VSGAPRAALLQLAAVVARYLPQMPRQTAELWAERILAWRAEPVPGVAESWRYSADEVAAALARLGDVSIGFPERARLRELLQAERRQRVQAAEARLLPTAPPPASEVRLRVHGAVMVALVEAYRQRVSAPSLTETQSAEIWRAAVEMGRESLSMLQGEIRQRAEALRRQGGNPQRILHLLDATP